MTGLDNDEKSLDDLIARVEKTFAFPRMIATEQVTGKRDFMGPT